jgi:hypothetical protein
MFARTLDGNDPPESHVVREGPDMYDQFDVTLEDADLLGEVELTTNLIIAASESDDHLSQEEIDRILGIDVRPPEPPEPRREA